MEGTVAIKRIVVYPMFGERYEVPVEEAWWHGGGDPRMLEDIFGEPEHDPTTVPHPTSMAPCQFSWV